MPDERDKRGLTASITAYNSVNSIFEFKVMISSKGHKISTSRRYDFGNRNIIVFDHAHSRGVSQKVIQKPHETKKAPYMIPITDDLVA